MNPSTGLRRLFRFVAVGLALAVLPSMADAASPVRNVVGRDVEHVVQAGELLPDIARKYGIAMEHLAWANGIGIRKEAPAGWTLRIPLRRVLPANPPRDGLVLNIPERGIYYFRNGQFQKFYPVAVGRPDFKTPRGQFSILNKTKDPTWFPPDWANLDREFVPPGPENPLGDRWMGVTSGGVGIHSTTSPYSIGMAASHGCIRMYPDLARELYDRVYVGMPVRIEYETAKLGKDRSTGELFVATWPDIYGLGDPQKVAQRLLRQAGVGDLSVVGYETRSLEAPTVSFDLRVNGRAVAAPLAVRQDGVLFVAPSALADVGLTYRWDALERAIVLSDAEREVVVPLSGSGALAGRSIGGRGVVPVVAVLQEFGIASAWDAEANALDVELPTARL